MTKLRSITIILLTAASMFAADTNIPAQIKVDVNTNTPPAVEAKADKPAPTPKAEAPAPTTAPSAQTPQKPVVTPDELYQLIVLARKSTTGQLHENFRAVQQLLMLCDKVEAAITQRP